MRPRRSVRRRGSPRSGCRPSTASSSELAAATDRRTSLEKGAGAAGGLGFALLLLGADRRPGFDVVAEAVDLPARARAADLVVTGEGAFDFSSRSGKVPYGVATVAAEALRPCVALAGRVLVGSREMRALGIESAYSLVDLVGEERALDDPARQPGRARRAGGPHLVALSRPAGPLVADRRGITPPVTRIGAVRARLAGSHQLAKEQPA